MGSEGGSEMSLNTPKNICCLGVEDVGLTACTMMAHMCSFVKVAVVDLDPSKVTICKTKQMASAEPGLDEMLKKCQNKNLVLTVDTKSAVREAEIIFISVPMPSKKSGFDNGVPDLTELEKSAKLIAEVVKDDKIIVQKSTLPFGAHKRLKSILDENKAQDVNLDIVYNPEFYSAGTAIENLLCPDRVIIGSDDTERGHEAVEALAKIYEQWVPREKIITMNLWSSEIVKLASNAFLAQRLSSINTISMICDATGSDVSEVIKVLTKFSSVGSQYLEPCVAFGGERLEKDLRTLIYMCKRMNLTETADYWNEVLKINSLQRKNFRKKILRMFFNTMKDKKVAIWGLAFKQNTRVLVNSPAVYICKSLLKESAQLYIYDPLVEKKQIVEELKKSLGEALDDKKITMCEDAYKAAYKADAIVCCTNWEEFQKINYEVVYRDMIKPALLFDGRKFLPEDELKKIGFEIHSIG